jgi:hypothetical protein
VPERLASFVGEARCQRSAALPGFTVNGVTAERPGEPTVMTFATPAPSDLPDTLLAPTIERLAPGRYLIAASAGSWTLAARGVELHREVAPAFYAALPPRPVPWTKRLFWRVVLTLAASGAGLAALRRLRR